jgi:hypothetical protein
LSDAPNLSDLTPEERGFVLGAGLSGEGSGGGSMLTEPAGGRVAAVLAALAALPRHERAAVLGKIAGDTVFRPPPELAQIHPTWIEAAFEAEPSDIILALVAGLPQELREIGWTVVRRRHESADVLVPATIDPELLPEVHRFVLAGVLVLLGEGAGPIAVALAGLALPEFIESLARRGAETLGRSLLGAPGPVLARAMASVGPKWADVVAGAAAQMIEPAAREQARRLIEAAADAQASLPEERLQEIGALALHGELATEGEASVRRIAGRLPMSLGGRVLSGP